MKGLTSVLALDSYEEIHRAGFCDMITDEPENLVITLLVRLLLWLERRGIVPTELELASATRPRADLLADRLQREQPRASAEVGAGRTADAVESRVIGGSDPENCEVEQISRIKDHWGSA